MILSIGMIVKNEEKYLDECLTALLPILNNLDSELIIVDTGSTDSTVEIAKKYTNKVYYFEWCNDFAAARNVTLDHAKGEWYMFLDADEIIQDTSELMNFFKSNEYKNYECAKYEIMNFNNEDKNSYSSMYSHRLYKINQNTKFVDTIHEYIPVSGKIKSLVNTILYHYGYIFINPKFRQAKSKRNIDLMLKEIEKKPDDQRLRSHLVDSYLIASDFESAITHAKIGIEICIKTTNFNYYYCSLQTSLVSAYIRINNYLNAIEEISNYFKYIKMTLATNIDIYYFMALANYELKNYKHCIDAYNKYKDLIKKNKNKKLDTYDLNYRPIFFIDTISINNLTLIAVDSYIQIKDYNNASKLLLQPSLKNLNMINNITMYFNLQLELMKKTNNYINLFNLYNNIATENKTLLTELENTIELFYKTNEDQKYKILECINNWNMETDYVSYVKIKYLSLYDNTYDINFLIDFLKSDIELKTYHSDLLYYIIEKNLPISLIFKNIDEKLLITYVDSLCNSNNDFIIKLLSYTYKPESIEDNFLLSIIYENTINNISTTEKPEHIMKLYNNYLENLNIFISFTYNDNILNSNNLNYIDFLPNNILSGYYLLMAEASKNSNDKSNYIKYLKLSLKINEKNKNLISILLDIFQNDNEIENKEPKSEFDKLADTIKDNIKSFINSGNIIQAKEILSEYRLINPNDKEIELIEKLF